MPVCRYARRKPQDSPARAEQTPSRPWQLLPGKCLLEDGLRRGRRRAERGAMQPEAVRPGSANGRVDYCRREERREDELRRLIQAHS